MEMSECRSAEGSSLEAKAPVRRTYERPELTEFGSVTELTRAGTGSGKEPQTAKKGGRG